jgi:cell wall-associated NlpC family hydrolase
LTDCTEVVAAARELVGVRFQHQGRTQFGVDCVGVPIVVGKRLGILPRTMRLPNYGRMPSPALLEHVESYMIPCAAPMVAPMAGTMVAIAWRSNPLPSHVAICTGATLVHAYESAGRVVEHGYTRTWRLITHSVWMFPGVCYG